MNSFSDEIVKSGLLKREPYVMIKGIVTNMVLNSIKSAFLNTNNRNSVIFFANYSELDIPIGTHFQKVFDPVTNHMENVKCELEEVTQEFGRPFDHIPSGWKTICKFKFTNEIPLLIQSLPKIDDWSDKKSNSVILTTSVFWEEYLRITSETF